MLWFVLFLIVIFGTSMALFLKLHSRVETSKTMQDSPVITAKARVAGKMIETKKRFGKEIPKYYAIFAFANTVTEKVEMDAARYNTLAVGDSGTIVFRQLEHPPHRITVLQFDRE